MKYYKLSKSINTKEIGKYPQCVGVDEIGNISGLGLNGPIKNNLKKPEPILQAKAKATTYLSVVAINSNIFLVLKKYFIDFLNEFNTGTYQYWPLKVHYRKNILTDYYLFHLSYPSEEKYVDYTNSEFLIGKLGDWKDTSIRKSVKVKNYKNYISLLEVLYEDNTDKSEIRCNKLVLNLSQTKEDIFRLYKMPYMGSGYYISERLKNAIEEKRFTGMDFKEIEEYNKKFKVIY